MNFNIFIIAEQLDIVLKLIYNTQISTLSVPLTAAYILYCSHVLHNHSSSDECPVKGCDQWSRGGGGRNRPKSTMWELSNIVGYAINTLTFPEGPVLYPKLRCPWILGCRIPALWPTSHFCQHGLQLLCPILNLRCFPCPSTHWLGCLFRSTIPTSLSPAGLMGLKELCTVPEESPF